MQQTRSAVFAGFPAVGRFPRAIRFLAIFLSSVGLVRLPLICTATVLICICLAGGDSQPRSEAQEQAYDKIWVEADGGKRIASYPGRIVQYNFERLELQGMDGGRTRTFPADKIKRVQTTYTTEHVTALEALENGDISAGYEMLTRAYLVEPRAWVQQEILAQQIQVARTRSEFTLAAQLFVKLMDEEPQTRFFHTLPLFWETRSLTTEERALAEQLIQSKNDNFALLGASWLLSSPSRQKALEKLKELSTDIDMRVASLATCQLWRIDVLTASTNDLQRWEQLLERLPSDLRAGPTLLLGTGWARQPATQRNIDDTVVLLMRVPILYPEHHHEAAAALYQSARLLEEVGRNREAHRIYLELVGNYRNTKSMEVAAQSPIVRELLNRQ